MYRFSQKKLLLFCLFGFVSASGCKVATTATQADCATESSCAVTSTDPVVSKLFPEASSVAGAVTLEISGKNFKEPLKVYIHDDLCFNLDVISTELMTCSVPSQPAGSYPIEIVQESKSFVSTTKFSYTSEVFPTIVSITTSPSPLPLSGGTVSISGTNFKDGISVTIDGLLCANPVRAGNSVTCTAPESLPGYSNASVINKPSDGGSFGLSATMANSVRYSGTVSYALIDKYIIHDGCTGCHGNNRQDGGKNYSYKNSVDTDINVIISDVVSGNMPRNGSALSQRKVDALKSYRGY